MYSSKFGDSNLKQVGFEYRVSGFTANICVIKKMLNYKNNSTRSYDH